MKNKKIRMLITIDREVSDDLKKYSKQSLVPKSTLINDLLKNFLKNK